MQLHNREQKVNTKQLFKIKYLKPYFRNIVNTVNYGNATNFNEHAFQLLLVPLESIIPTNMVRTRVRGNLRMRKQNIKTAVPLEVAPERRTERFPPRFQPVGRFCELRFRYLSSPTGNEEEISRPIFFFYFL